MKTRAGFVPTSEEFIASVAEYAKGKSQKDISIEIGAGRNFIWKLINEKPGSIAQEFYDRLCDVIEKLDRT